MSRNISGKTGLARRYATALFSALQEEGDKAISAVELDLTALDESIRVSPELKKLLNNPLAPQPGIVKILLAIIEKSNKPAHKLTHGLLLSMAGQKRLSLLLQVIALFREDVLTAKGERKVRVTTAIPLNDAQRKNLQQGLKKMAGDRVTLEETVSPHILGGMIVRIGSKMLDLSVLNKLERFKLAKRTLQTEI